MQGPEKKRCRHFGTASSFTCLAQVPGILFLTVAAVLVFMILLFIPLVTYAATDPVVTDAAAKDVATDFTMHVRVNGMDIQQHETIIFDPKEKLTVDLYISDVISDVTLESLSVVTSFAWQKITTLRKDLNSFHIPVGGYYRDTFVLTADEGLGLSSLGEFTGVFGVTVELNYLIGVQPKELSLERRMKIPGNPINTAAGKTAAAVAGGAVIAGVALARSLTLTGVAAGTTIPGGVVVKSVPGLYDFVRGRLEPTARSRVMSNIVKAVRSRIHRERCPLCNTCFKHGHCYNCRKPTKQVRNEYSERLTALTVEGARLIADGEVSTPDELGSRLGVNDRMAGDVFAVLNNAKLVKIRGLSKKLLGKAIIMGVTSGLSIVLWVTIGGLVALDTWALVAITVGSIAIPFILIKSLQAKARRELKREA